SVGVGVIILTNLVLLPTLMSYIGISKSAVERNRDLNSRPQRLWRGLSGFAHPAVAPISVVIAVVAFAFGIYHGQKVEVGDLYPGAPLLEAAAHQNMDIDFIIPKYSPSSNVLVVIVSTPPETCSAYETMEAIHHM